MATVDFLTMPTDMVPTSEAQPEETTSDAPRVHRIRTVRLQQGTSLRSVARQTGTDVRQLRLQEQESTDLRLSDLFKWQKALDVPLAELLVEPDSALSRPILDRARLIRVMKTVAAIRERAQSVGIQRMAEMLVEQLVEIMPELREVSPWHNFGQRRGLDECGRIVENTIPDDLMRAAGHD